MIKKIAWDTFKNTGDINSFLEFKQIENLENSMENTETQSDAQNNIKNSELENNIQNGEENNLL